MREAMALEILPMLEQFVAYLAALKNFIADVGPTSGATLIVFIGVSAADSAISFRFSKEERALTASLLGQRMVLRPYDTVGNGRRGQLLSQLHFYSPVICVGSA
jgi:hypothetical protein